MKTTSIDFKSAKALLSERDRFLTMNEKMIDEERGILVPLTRLIWRNYLIRVYAGGSQSSLVVL